MSKVSKFPNGNIMYFDTQLVATVATNIGQVKEEDADKEIERLNNQSNNLKWRKDYSDEMYVIDETDENVHNPMKRNEGYVFIICEW